MKKPKKLKLAPWYQDFLNKVMTGKIKRRPRAVFKLK